MVFPEAAPYPESGTRGQPLSNFPTGLNTQVQTPSHTNKTIGFVA